VNLPILTAAGGAEWEARLIAEVDAVEAGIQIVRRCVDIIDLLAVAAAGQAVGVLVDARFRRFDADAVDRLSAAGVAVVGVIAASGTDHGPTDLDRLSAVGVAHFVPADANAQVVAGVLQSAVADFSGEHRPDRGFADPAFASGSLVRPANDVGDGVSDQGPAADRQGSVVAVWGPTGAPGRTTIAVTLADELSRLSHQVLLIDSDVYGGVIASVLGLLDESPGFAAACRHAQSRRLDEARLAALAWQISPTLRTLTGIPRADRWPELRTTAIEGVLAVARTMADFTVVDVGFALETDEELSFDTLAPRRNGATLTVLDNADLILAVGSADPIGIQRLVRGIGELREVESAAPVWITLNRVRRGAVPGDPADELDAALDRFVGQRAAALLPYDRAGLDRALSVGKTIGEAVPGSPFRRAAIELASAIAGVPPPERSRRRR